MPSAFTAIAAGYSHSCALTDLGGAVCWGDNNLGQTDAPQGTFTAITAGHWYSCALTAQGRAVCWGRSLGSAPQVPLTAISAGEHHSCGITDQGRAVCWGEDHDGKTDAPQGTFTAIAAGGRHSCGITDQARAVCWGINAAGELDPSKLDPPQGTYAAITAGDGYSCALTAQGQAVCWGDEGWGQTDAPQGTFTAISTGSGHSCALNDQGWAVCWGGNVLGRADAPQGTFTAIAAGWAHSCAIDDQGQAVCWGDKSWGQANAPAPTATPTATPTPRATPAPTATPLPDGNLLAFYVIDRSHDSLTVRWRARSRYTSLESVDYYQLSRRTQESRREPLKSQPVDSPYTDKGLQPNTIYYYSIQACNDSGCGDRSEEVAGLTESSGPVDVPPTPTGVRGLKFDVTWASDDAGISWRTVETATYYQVYQDSRFDAELSAPRRSYRDNNPNTSGGSFTTTTYKVRACNKAGCSPFSEIVTVH